MNPVYLVVLVLGILIFIENRFKIALLYSLILNLLLSLLCFFTEIYLGMLILIFGLVFFSILLITIKRTENRERRSRTVAGFPLIFLPFLYLLFTLWNIPEDLSLLYTLFLYAFICILIDSNLLRYLLIFNFIKNVFLLFASYFTTPLITEGLEVEILIETASLLPVIILAFLTIRLYEKYGSLGLWHIWD